MTLKLGDKVTFIDPLKKEHNALVTCIHGSALDETPSINIILVSDDAAKEDSYGRQMERQTSCVPIDNQSAKANCYKID